MVLKNLKLYGAFLVCVVASYINLSQDGPCTSDADVQTAFGAIGPCDCFSETYLEAREKFVSAAIDARAEHSVIQVYQNYTMDIAYLPGVRNDDLVVHTSGVHGVEGYAGSAIQIAFLKNWLSEKNANRPSLLLIHAVNPFGMAVYRRFNENNVDLNRNGLHDFSKIIQRDPNIAGYVDLDQVFNPMKPFRFGFALAFTSKFLQHGLLKLKNAMVTGQYHNPSGIFYGGVSLEASNQQLLNFFQTFLSAHPVLGKTTWINIHTGLGKYGTDTIMIPTERFTWSPEIAKVFVNSRIPYVFPGDDSVHAGYEIVVGTTEELMRPLFPATDDWCVTQEFGTHSLVTVGRALILENMQYNHYNTSSMLLRDVFYPRTPKWRREILTRGLQVIKQAMER